MKIRYTTGPAELSFGGHNLVKNKWVPVSKKLADEVKKQPHKGMYDFEVSGTNTKEKE